MSRLEEWLFPFDGSCDGSKDAGLNLTFDEGQPLKIETRLLVLASPVLKVAVEECRSDGTIDLGSDNRQAWRLLLHLLHPRAVSRVLRYWHHHDDLTGQLEPVLFLCEKYSMIAAQDLIEGILECKVKEQTRQVFQQRGHSALMSEILSKKNVFSLAVWCVRHELWIALEACEEHLQNCLAYCNQIQIAPRRLGFHSSNSGVELSKMIQQLNDMGRQDVALRIAQDLLRSINTC